MKKSFKIIIGIFFVIGALQFLPVNFPEMETDNIASIDKVQNVPDDILMQLKNSCYDCHSNASKIEWYHKIRPASWLVKKHIIEGKEHLNFSEWANYDAEEQKELFEESAEEIEKGKMPMPPYLPFHPEAKMSDEMKTTLIDWLNNASQ